MRSQKVQVPHSQRSPRENPKFLQNFRSKNNWLKENFWLKFLFNFSHCKSGLAHTIQKYYIASQNCVYSIKENSPNLHQKPRWTSWMRHQSIKKETFRAAHCLIIDNLPQKNRVQIFALNHVFLMVNLALWQGSKALFDMRQFCILLLKNFQPDIWFDWNSNFKELGQFFQ
jgi:hypothetical protein